MTRKRLAQRRTCTEQKPGRKTNVRRHLYEEEDLQEVHSHSMLKSLKGPHLDSRILVIGDRNGGNG
jgi:hypothetical protein